MKSNFLKLDVKDLLRGLLMAILTSVVLGLGNVLQTGVMPDFITIKGILLTGLAAGFVYLGKNLLTNSEDKLLKKD